MLVWYINDILYFSKIQIVKFTPLQSDVAHILVCLTLVCLWEALWYMLYRQRRSFHYKFKTNKIVVFLQIKHKTIAVKILNLLHGY